MALEYETWKQEHAPLLATFSQKKVFMLFTGGKDSSAVLWLLLQASREFGFSFETHTARYPLHVFPDEEVEKLNAYWRAQGVEIRWHEVDASDEALAEAQLRGDNPCRRGQHIKRTCLYDYMLTLDYKMSDIVLILSYSLWDLVSYSLEHLVERVYSVEKMSAAESEDRLLRTSQRFFPLIQLTDGLTIFKPLLKYNNQEIFQVVKKQGLPLSEVVCAYTRYTPKRILFDYYRQTDAHFDYDNVISYVKSSFQIHELAAQPGISTLQLMKSIL
jgi:tRNA(Ile)-lysidine synthase TilS/MesJ